MGLAKQRGVLWWYARGQQQGPTADADLRDAAAAAAAAASSAIHDIS